MVDCYLRLNEETTRTKAALCLHASGAMSILLSTVIDGCVVSCQQVQRLFFKHVPKLRDLALANCGSVEKRDTLRKYLNLLEPEELKFLVTQQLRYGPLQWVQSAWVLAAPHNVCIWRRSEMVL